MAADPGKFAILVGGGPAPGINSVIAAAVLRIQHAGGAVLGVRNGFSELMQGRSEGVFALSGAEVRGIHVEGGAILGTSRANPTKRPEDLERVVQTLARLGVSRLITIGGDDTAFSAMKVAERAGAQLRVAHVPKTIDDDLDLPPHISTFGFQTARHLGVELVRNLMTDARTTGRWYVVIAMGRKAGSLALSIGKAAGAALTLIPEEFAAGKGSLDRIADTLVGAIVKRRVQGGRHGLAVLAEGVAETIPEGELHRLGPVEHDEHGHIRLAEIDLGRGVRKVVEERLRALGIPTGIVSKDIGYELRCADPIPFDVEYTRDLGYCAAQFLLDGGSGAMVSVQEGRFVPIPFSTMIDPATGRTRVRTVDMASLRYTVARQYMTRLERQDFSDSARLAALAGQCAMDPGAFRDRFFYVVEGD
ncbi:diphosphate--fructose-6-phosphate 1-phosphotransferase [Thiomonas sp.]|uniref:diphosphate--fructose-6-phosphate 1-phosphotransferase n=1 Tax=Thiomonas sp. TaxID=2047785 RepID=UPI002620D589|nr:diphosphate--fructose-6-phosphate 1-phosphotransferase [Thiomonas sp.]